MFLQGEFFKLSAKISSKTITPKKTRKKMWELRVATPQRKNLFSICSKNIALVCIASFDIIRLYNIWSIVETF